MVKQIFVNLPVKDLEKTKAFFAALGFTFNPQFTDENAACMVMSENIFAMLLQEPFFKTFTNKAIADATQSTEVINAISVGSRAEVDELFDKAIKAGATTHKEKADDYGWMYSRAFTDLDGHMWEVLYGDLSQAPANP